MSNAWEVEQKYKVADREAFFRRLTEQGFTLSHTESNCDEYFRHPSRNFRETDEALRLRRIDNHAVMTYKGPKKGGNVKTRQEIELPIGDEDFEKWSETFQKLGFEVAAQVKKSRQVYRHQDPAQPLVTFDDVEGVGTYAEVEMIANSEAELEAAQNVVRATAGQLGLEELERRSYLGMLLAIRGVE